MPSSSTFQIVISGVGGQGVLFVTRLLAEAAIAKGLPVFTSETHGMAQRGGTVISHLKVGEFASPLISPGHADGLIALKAEGLNPHAGYLKPGGWATVNGGPPTTADAPTHRFGVDADQLARQMGQPKSVNLIMLGFTFAVVDDLFCDVADINGVLQKRFGANARRLAAARLALQAGVDGGAA